MAKLFKEKILKKRLENFEIFQMEEKLEILHNWYKASQTGNLKEKSEKEVEQSFGENILGNILGYIGYGSADIYLREAQPKAEGTAQKADFGLGYFDRTGVEKNLVKVVMEVKDARTPLDKPQQREGSLTPVQQGFKYKPFFKNCDFVIVSNFIETRLFYDNYSDYEVWTLADLVNSKEDYYNFRKFYYLLCSNNLLARRGESITKKLLSDIRIEQESITKSFYKEYSLLRKELYGDLLRNNADENGKITKEKAHLLLEKTQKIIDRLIFIHFCEDIGFLPQGKLKENVLRAEEIGFTPWEMLKRFFEFVNSGSKNLGIPNGYNGGLFHADSELDTLKVGNEICKKFIDLGRYDFEDDLSVNILGHIFEQSISDIEELKETIHLSAEEERVVSKRKKDGIFYTPEYIVDYIVRNSVGKKIEDWEQDLKEKHKFKEDLTDKNYEKRAIAVYQELQEKLQNITVLDPACGSGAFLVKVFDFLKEKHKEISRKLEDLGVNQGFFGTEEHFKNILQKNIYGVDLNEESVEITKLSLWLKTASKGKKLANLDGNIKCGNSLIDDPSIAGEKAFNWQEKFPEIFQQKNKKAFHVTWVTHNSRVSERMIEYKVEKGEGIYLDEDAEVQITRYIGMVVQEEDIKVLAYNICVDHIHILLVCEEEELSNIVQKLKSVSARKFNIERGYTVSNKGIGALVGKGEEQNHLWAQKYHSEEITNDEQLKNTVEYITHNRQKHELSDNKGVEDILSGKYIVYGNEDSLSGPLVGKSEAQSHLGVQKDYSKKIPVSGKQDSAHNKGSGPLVGRAITMLTSYEEAFTLEYTGGFDVIVGNPPYVVVGKNEHISKMYQWNEDLYLMFFEKAFTLLLKYNGTFGFITPRFFLVNQSSKKFRQFILEKINLVQLVETSPFEDAQTECVISIFDRGKLLDKIEILKDNNGIIESKHFIFKNIPKNNKDFLINTSLTSDQNTLLGKMYTHIKELGDIVVSKRGMEVGKPFLRGNFEGIKTMIGQDINKFSFNFENTFILGSNKEFIRLRYFFEGESIYLRRVAKDLISYIGKDYAYNKNIYGLKITDSNFSNRYILTLLNSKLLSFYYKSKFSTKKGDLFPEIQTYLYNQLPIKNISLSQQQPFIEKADFMLEYNKEVNLLVQKFLGRVSGTFNLEKYSGKLENFWKLSFAEFVKELEKCKVKLSLKDQDEWEEYFASYKTQVAELKAKIEACDKQIDEMVFDLYGLTQEEREVILNS